MTTYKNRFFEFSTGFRGIKLSYTPCGYYDDKCLTFSPGWGIIFIKLGESKYEHDVNDTTNYGFYYYESSLVIQYGKKSKFIYMPWYYDWVRTSYLLKDGSWANETKSTKRYSDFYEGLDLSLEEYSFMDKYNGIVTSAIVGVIEREWRQRWLKWTSLFNMKSRVIDVEFERPIGKGVGTWKGGTTGCSYEMKEGENPINTILRMQEERNF